MYRMKPGTKRDLRRRWNLPDRVFFGHGACHILAGVFLDLAPLSGFHAEWIAPAQGFSGNHIYVTNGTIAFDFHGYSARQRLVDHHRRGWSRRYPGWRAEVCRVAFDLLDTKELNARKMRGPDQYSLDPVPRARRFVSQVDHAKAARKAEAIAASHA